MRAIFLVLLLVLSACARPVAPTAAGSFKTIGVASTLGQTVTLKEVGMTVFGNSESDIEAGSWGIDDAIAREATRLLARRYDAQVVPLDPAALGNTHFPGEAGIFSSSRPIGEALRDALGGQGRDAYVLVVPRGAQLGLTNQMLGGLGLLKAYGGAFGLRGDDYDLYALYYVSVFDGKTFALIGDARAPSRGFMPAIRGPRRTVDAGWWPARQGVLSPAQEQQLRDGLVDLVRETLPATLRELNLGD
jgi:hypothetical protein